MKLSKIYSNDPRFKKIDFNPGLNVIYGYVGDSTNVDSHNLGKSALAQLIDFMLLKELKKGGYFFNKKKVFEKHVFYLEIELNDGRFLTIRRSFQQPTYVDIAINDEKKDFLENAVWDYERILIKTKSKKKIAATQIINEYINLDIHKNYNYRKFLGYFIRSQLDYNDVFQLNKFKGKDNDWKPEMFELLGFDSTLLLEKYKNQNEINVLKEKINNLMKVLELNDIDLLNGQIDILNREKEELEEDLDTFNLHINEKDLNIELIDEVEEESSYLNKRYYDLKTDINTIEKSLKSIEYSDFLAIEEMFNEIKIYFGDQLKKSYKELINFNKSLSVDRNIHLGNLLENKRTQLNKIEEDLSILGKKRAEIFTVLNDSDVLEKYKFLRSNLIEKEKKIQDLYTKKEIVLSKNEDMKNLTSKKSKLDSINQSINEAITNGNETLNNIRYIYKQILKKLTGKNGMIKASVNKNFNVEYEAGIIDDSGSLTFESEGFSYKKILCICLDLALLQYYSSESFFRFVYHDGPFEALHTNRKDSYLDFIQKYCEGYDIQYIISVIDSDVSEDKFNEGDIVLRLSQGEDGDGTLFGFNY